jgi:hypothetical protein
MIDGCTGFEKRWAASLATATTAPSAGWSAVPCVRSSVIASVPPPPGVPPTAGFGHPVCHADRLRLRLTDPAARQATQRRVKAMCRGRAKSPPPASAGHAREAAHEHLRVVHGGLAGSMGGHDDGQRRILDEFPIVRAVGAARDRDFGARGRGRFRLVVDGSRTYCSARACPPRSPAADRRCSPRRISGRTAASAGGHRSG